MKNEIDCGGYILPCIKYQMAYAYLFYDISFENIINKWYFPIHKFVI